MSEGAGSARGAKKKNALVRVFCLFRVRCAAFLRKTEVFLKNIGCNVFYRRPRFLYKTYKYLHFQESLGFFSKNHTKNAEQKRKMPGHVLRELQRFLERNKNTQNKKSGEKKKKKKKKKKKNTHTHRTNTGTRPK